MALVAAVCRSYDLPIPLQERCWGRFSAPCRFFSIVLLPPSCFHRSLPVVHCVRPDHSRACLGHQLSHSLPFDPKEQGWQPFGGRSVQALSLFPDSPAFPLLPLLVGPSRTGCNERSVPALPWKAVTRPSSPARTMGAASLSTSNGLISTVPTSPTRPAAWSSPQRRAAAPWTA